MIVIVLFIMCIKYMKKKLIKLYMSAFSLV